MKNTFLLSWMALAWRLGALSLLTLNSCPELSRGAPEACTKAYEQCTLATGVLGVCDQVACAEGQAEPCLVCRSQH